MLVHPNGEPIRMLPKSTLKRVVIESPFAGTTHEALLFHVSFARACMADSLQRGEAPYLSHLLYTQVLKDSVPEQRSLGITAGLSWGACADLCAVYTNIGISTGMRQGIANANDAGIPIEERQVSKELMRAFGVTNEQSGNSESDRATEVGHEFANSQSGN